MIDFRLLAVAAVLLALGLALQVWSTGRNQVARRHTFRAPALLMYSLAATIVVFSVFPSSAVNGQILGFALGGAAAFATVVWALAVRWTAPNDEVSRLLVENNRLAEEVERLQQRIAEELTHRQPERLTETIRYAYQLVANPDRIVGIITGDLLNVHGADVWINSENTNMEMARPADPTISGLMRYHGGRRDEFGYLVDDIIYNELRAVMGKRRVVTPSTALVTGSGELRASHGVEHIVHVASVEGSPAAGFRQVADVRTCLLNALARVDALHRPNGEASVVVVPLFGTGVGGADIRTTATILANAALEYLRGREQTRIAAVYLLARTDVRLDILRAVLDAKPELRPAGKASADHTLLEI